MIATSSKRGKVWHPTALLLSVILASPLFTSCGGGRSTAPPPVDDTRGGTQTAPGPGNAPQRTGLSTGQKVGITLVGAAALYYLYRQHQKSQQEGAQGKYYLSKNGRVYYRDAQHRAHFVTPPSEGIRVPQDQAQQYQEFQGYNGRPTGRSLNGLGQDAVPAGAQ